MIAVVGPGGQAMTTELLLALAPIAAMVILGTQIRRSAEPSPAR